MHRQGFQIYQVAEAVSKPDFVLKNILTGLFTHLLLQNPTKQEQTLAQIAQFEMWRKAFKVLDSGNLTRCGECGCAWFILRHITIWFDLVLLYVRSLAFCRS